MKEDRSIVGSLINFRGLVYSPVNEQGVVFLFGRVLEDLNMYIEEVRIKYPDCVARRYIRKGWELVYIEFEYLASNFILHGHAKEKCDIIVCWEDNLTDEQRKELSGIEIIELKSIINTNEIPNIPIKEPSKTDLLGKKYDLEHHYKRKNVAKNIRKLYEKLEGNVLGLNDEIFNKYAKTEISFYSPEKMFLAVKLRKTLMVLHLFTNQQKISGVKNINFHENWGAIRIINETDLNKAIKAIQESYSIMREAIKNNIKTNWYAVTPKEKITWKTNESEESDDDNE